MSVPVGQFMGLQACVCVCGFEVEEYDDGRYAIEYADPATGEVIARCPECRRGLNLRDQAPRPVASSRSEPR